MYKLPNALDKQYKPLILKWLSNHFKIPYNHSFKDQWITWNVWNSILSINLDLRDENQRKLFEMLPNHIKGTIQYKTLKHVNTDVIYIPLNMFLNLKYPTIVKDRVIKTITHSESGESDWYEYDREISLSDGTSIYHRNQSKTQGLEYNGFIYKSILDTRTFYNFLKISI